MTEQINENIFLSKIKDNITNKIIHSNNLLLDHAKQMNVESSPLIITSQPLNLLSTEIKKTLPTITETSTTATATTSSSSYFNIDMLPYIDNSVLKWIIIIAIILCIIYFIWNYYFATSVNPQNNVINLQNNIGNNLKNTDNQIATKKSKKKNNANTKNKNDNSSENLSNNNSSNSNENNSNNNSYISHSTNDNSDEDDDNNDNDNDNSENNSKNSNSSVNSKKIK